MRTRIVALALTTVLLGGCAGAGGSSALSPAPAHRASTPASTPAPTPSIAPAATRVAAKVTIDGNADTVAKARARHPAAAGARAPAYISPSTLGISLSVNGGALQAFDVSPGSPLCTSGSPRTCTLPLAANAGTQTFVMRTYNTAPVGGAIPNGASLLGSSTIAQTIVANAVNSVVFYIAGQIAGIGASTGGFASLPADGTPRSVGVTLLAFDAGANAIAAGANDPYANPITLSLSEVGGAGHAYLVVNGANVGASATLTHSSDTVAVAYDGAGTPGYTTTLGASAIGAGTFTFRLSPLYVAGSYIAGNSVTFTAPGQVSSLAATEASAPSGVGYSATLTPQCSPNASVGGAAGSGASYTANLTDVNAPANGSGCSLVVSDSLGSSLTLPVTFPTPTQDCATGPAGVQITPSTVGNGTPCPLVVTPTTLTLYVPSDASHPGTGAVVVTERNLNGGGFGFTSNGCPGVTIDVANANTTGASYGSTATMTVNVTATTANSSCTLNYQDPANQTTPGTIIVDPAGTRLGSASGSQSGSVAYCYLQLFDPGYPCQPGVDNKSIVLQQFPNVTLAPTSPGTALSATVTGTLLSNSNCHWIDIHVEISPPGYTSVFSGSTAYTTSTELDSGTKTFTVTWYDPAAPTGTYVIQEDASCGGGPNYQPAVPFGGNGKASAVVNLDWSYAQ